MTSSCITSIVDSAEAKIEDLPSHFIGWTSSVFVAFALPDLYFIATWRDADTKGEPMATQKRYRNTGPVFSKEGMLGIAGIFWSDLARPGDFLRTGLFNIVDYVFVCLISFNKT